jgi:hypothetical protein
MVGANAALGGYVKRLISMMAGVVNAADEGWAFIRASPRFPVA